MSNFWGAVHIFLSFYSFLIVKHANSVSSVFSEAPNCCQVVFSSVQSKPLFPTVGDSERDIHSPIRFVIQIPVLQEINISCTHIVNHVEDSDLQLWPCSIIFLIFVPVNRKSEKIDRTSSCIIGRL